MSKKTGWILKMCLAFCLAAGVSTLAAGCGDDDSGGGGGGGGGGQSCGPDEISAEVGGQVGCHTKCKTVASCPKAGAKCITPKGGSQGVCVGGNALPDSGIPDSGAPDSGIPDSGAPDSGAPDSGAPDGGTGTPDGGNPGPNCADGEVAVRLAGETMCASECADVSECTGEEECLPLDSNTSACVVVPTGDRSCSSVLTCQTACPRQGEPNFDPECTQNCVFEGTSDAQDQLDALNQCANDKCANSSDVTTCVQTKCNAESKTCAGCTADQDVVNFTCLEFCQSAGDCDADESCVVPTLPITDQKVCSYSPENLGGPCADDPECGGPDPDVTDAGGGTCSVQAPGGGMCLANGCNPDAGYGAKSGCGFEAICNGQSCRQLCHQSSDCSRGETDDYSCRIISKAQDGVKTGICGPQCATDANCQFTDSSTGQMLQGQCNDTGYCELPCDGMGQCANRGGSCTGGFCVYE